MKRNIFLNSFLFLFLIIFISENVYSSTCNITYLNNNLVSCYKLEEEASPYVDEKRVMNFTAGVIPTRTSGFINYGQTFSNDYLNGADLYDNQNICYSAMIKNNGHAIAGQIFSSYYTAGNRQFLFQIDATEVVTMYIYDAVGGLNVRTVETLNNTWAMVTGCYNYTAPYNTDIYFNGNLRISGNTKQMGNFAGSLQFGSFNNGAGQFLFADIDIIRIWDKYLSQKCVELAYNLTLSGSECTFFEADSTLPNITLIYPVNNTRYNNYNGSIIINATDNILIDSCILNNSLWVYTENSSNLWRFDNATIPDGNYSIIATCNDTNSNVRNLSFNFLIDSIYPTINIFSPLNNSYHNSDILINISYYDLYLYKTNTSILTTSYNNYSGILLTEWYNITEMFNISLIADGNYNILFEATDTHTTNNFNEILDYEQGLTSSGKNSYIKYNMKYGEIELITPKEIKINTIVSSDRWKQNFYNILEEDLEEIEIEILADKIEYFETSNYNCHLILNGHYWFDCEGLQNAEMKEFSDTQAKFKFFHTIENSISDSIGGLNYINKTYIITIDTSSPNISDYNVTNGSTSIKWDLLFSENSTYSYTIGLNCSDSSIDTGNGISDFLTVTNNFLTSGISYYMNIILTDSATNNDTYCINGTTVGVTGVDYALIQTIIETAIDDEVESMNESIIILILFLLWFFLVGIALYLDNGTFIAFTGIFGLIFSITLFTTTEINGTLIALFMGLNAYILIILYQSKNG